MEFPGRAINLEQAAAVQRDLVAVAISMRLVDSVEFGRIAAQTAKQVIVQKGSGSRARTEL